TAAGVIRGKNGYGSYDPVAAVQSYVAQLEAQIDEVTEASSGEAFAAARARLYDTRAKAAGVELAARPGELVPVEVVERMMGSSIMVARERLLALGARLAPRLALVNSASAVRDAIDAEVHQALTDVANVEIVEG